MTFSYLDKCAESSTLSHEDPWPPALDMGDSCCGPESEANRFVRYGHPT